MTTTASIETAVDLLDDLRIAVQLDQKIRDQAAAHLDCTRYQVALSFLLIQLGLR